MSVLTLLVMVQAGDKLKGKANEAGRKAQNAVGDNAGLPSPQDVRPMSMCRVPKLPRLTCIACNLT